MSSSQNSLNRERGERALKEMSLIGFSKAKTKIVLKALLKSFDGNWNAIEGDNYSILVDALISHDEDQGFIQKKLDPINDDEDLERKEDSIADDTALCRKKVRSREEVPSPSLSDQGISDGERLKKSNSEDQHNPRYDVVLCSPQTNYKGKEIANPTDQMVVLHKKPTSRTHLNEQRPEFNRKRKSLCIREPEHELGIGSPLKANAPCNPDDGTYIGDSLSFPVPIAVVRPTSPSSGNRALTNTAKESTSSQGHLTPMAIHSESPRPQTAGIDKVANGSEDPLRSVHKADKSIVPVDVSRNVEIASSSNGAVKLSFSFNHLCQEKCFPNLDSVFRLVEERCLKSYKIIQPKFSLENLLTEMCETLRELSESPANEKVVNITPRVDALKISGVHHVFSNPSTIEIPGSSSNSSLNLATISHHEPALGDIRPLHDVNDISKGEERVQISLVNEISSEKFPPSFFYIPQNIVYQNGHLDFSLARIGDEDCCSDCFGDCLSASIPCACARDTGGKYAYTLDGLITKEFLDDCMSRFHRPEKHHYYYCKDCPIEKLKNDDMPEPCKGHLVRRFIKECWVKCGCNKQCGNRVVQRGITCNLQVFYTAEGKGWGVRTLHELPRGTFICEYVGEVLTNIELYERTIRTTNAKHTYPVLLDADWGSEGVLKDEESLCLDATFYGNVARFINHRCYDSNLIEIPVEVETPDHHYYHLAFFTNRKVEALEELTWDYGIDFDDDDHPVEAFRCKCGSRYCRSKKKSRAKSRASVR